MTLAAYGQQLGWVEILDPEEDRLRDELRKLCILGSAPHVCELLCYVRPEQLSVPVDQEGNSPLHIAAKCGHLKLLQELLVKERGFNIDCRDNIQRTPLHLACMEEHADIVLELIMAQADVSTIDDLKQTALHKIVQSGSLEVMQVLVEHGDPHLDMADAHGTTALLLAAELGKTHFVEYLLTREPGLALASNELGWTGLHLCSHGREMRRNSTKPGKFNTCAKILMDAKALVDAPDEDKKTPLHRAAQTGDKEIVQVLLQGGAHPSFEDYCRWTPLHYAAQDGHLDVARILLDAKAWVQQQSPASLTPLAVATMENQVKMAELLMKYGADHGLRGKGLASPIMIARKDPSKYDEILSLFELGFISHEG
jgi:ankyrin repeat protein